MPDLQIPFRQWLPDQPDLNNPGLVEAKNVYRLNGAYQPQTDIEFPGGDQSKSLGVSSPGGFKTAISFRNSSQPYYALLRGDNLIVIETGSAGTVLTTGISGNTGVVSDLVDFNGDIYYHSRGSVQYKSTGGGAFATTSATTQFGATSAARVNNFIMTGYNLNLKWSGFNQPESWAVSDLTQAGEAEVNNPELGFVTGIQGGVVNYIFQEFGVSRLTYVGPPKVWDVRPVSLKYGALRKSHIELNGITYFMGASSVADVSQGVTGRRFIAKTNGNAVQNISQGVVERWMNANFPSTGVSLEAGCHVTFDQPRRRLVWASGVGNNGPHKYLCMNIDTEEFSYFEGDYECFIPGPHHDADNGEALIAVADNGGTAHYGPLTGSTMEATLTTGHIANAGERAFLDQVEPQYSGSGATAALSKKERLRDDASFGSYVAENASTGIADVTADGRSIAVSVKYPATSDWSDFVGVVGNGKGAGNR